MSITCYTYRIPFQEPFKAGDNIYESRKGVILELKKGEITAYGEAAPLPGFSAYSLDEVLTQLKEFQSEIRELFQNETPRVAADDFYYKNQIKPSLQFALDTLITDWLSQKRGQPLADLLFEDYNNHININGVIGSSTRDEILLKSKSLINQGFNTLKFKIGPDIDGLIEVLNNIRQDNPDIALRIDANQSWSLEEAKANLTKLDKLNIEYCEEPLKKVSSEKLMQLRKATTVPVALDETIGQTEQLKSHLPYISFAILKPMMIGAFSKLFATKGLLSTHDITTVFTTSLESGIGRMMTATLASGLGAIQTAHGLATGSLLTMDVWDDGTYINNGRFTMPDNIGLGKGHKPDFENIVTQIFEL